MQQQKPQQKLMEMTMTIWRKVGTCW